MTTAAPDKALMRKQIYSGEIPDDVQLVYFNEGELSNIGSRVIVVALKEDPLRSSFTMGYSIFRRDNKQEKYDKKALRTTAYMRLQLKPITVSGPPDLVTAATVESRDEHFRHVAIRRQQWESCFGVVGSANIEKWPSVVWRHENESDAHYQERVQSANKSYLANFPDVPAAILDELRVQKTKLMNMRRSFIRQAVHANRVPKNEDVTMALNSSSAPTSFANALMASLLMGDGHPPTRTGLTSSRTGLTSSRTGLTSGRTIESRDHSRTFIHKHH